MEAPHSSSVDWKDLQPTRHHYKSIRSLLAAPLIVQMDRLFLTKYQDAKGQEIVPETM